MSPLTRFFAVTGGPVYVLVVMMVLAAISNNPKLALLLSGMLIGYGLACLIISFTGGVIK